MPVIGPNTALTIAQRALGARLNPYLSYNFLLELDMLVAGGFSEISGLSVQAEVETKTFGGENEREYHFWKGAKYSDLTLRYGLTDIDLLWNWYEDMINGKISRKNGTIYLLNHGGIPVNAWEFYEAYPIKWDGPTFDAGSSNVAVAELVLTHRGFKRVKSF